ncbi:hypothetical protein BC830DRAFT_1076836 [Chytriomyces sp. MP71]|nr:hypothetical protein BC830DRAFT_1076836 [Chytriomyces sp. MP71]
MCQLTVSNGGNFRTCETSPLHSDGYQDTISPARSSASQPSQYELYPQNTVLSDTGIHGLILGDCTSNHSETVNPIKTISQLLTEKEQIYGTILSPSSFGLSSRGGNEKAGLMCKIDDARMLEVQSEKRSAIFNQFTGIKQAASGSKDVATRERIPTLSTPPETWTVNEVVQWLQATGFSSELSRIFECAQIDGATLVSLSAEDMREQLSIEPLGLRLSVVDAIQKIEGLGIHQTGETVLDAPPAYEDVEFSHRTSPQKHQGDSSQEYTTP